MEEAFGAVEGNLSGSLGVGRSGIRWYELHSFDGGATWSLHQEGTHAPDDGLHRWMPSIAMNSAGDIGVGFMVSGEGMAPEIRVTGQTAASSGSGTFDGVETVCRAGVAAEGWVSARASRSGRASRASGIMR